MDRISLKLVIATSLAAVALACPSLEPLQVEGVAGSAFAEDSAMTEKEAFEAAKELGTVEAWNAFLANYSTGFQADLARAYLDKLSKQVSPALPPADDYPVVAGSWGGVVRDGPGQSYRKIDSLEEGAEVTLLARTDVMENGFPWFKIAYEGDGSGYQWGGILCSAGPERPDLFKTCSPAPAKRESAKPKTETKETAKTCSGGRVLIDGKCIKKSAAASYCGPGYRPQGGKCVPGYKPPTPSTPPSSEQRKAANKGCPKGQVWNAQEGCHEDD